MRWLCFFELVSAMLFIVGCHTYSFANVERLRREKPPLSPKTLSADILMPLAPLPKSILMGKWTATECINSFRYWDGDLYSRGPHLHTQKFKQTNTYEFYDDGTYVETTVRVYVSFAAPDETTIIQGAWDYDNGVLKLTAHAGLFIKNADDKRKKLARYRNRYTSTWTVTWASNDEIAIWQSSEEFEASYVARGREPSGFRVRNEFSSDKLGLMRHTRFVESKNDGSISDTILVRSHYRHVEMGERQIDHICGDYYYPVLEDVPKSVPQGQTATAPSYRIVTCERESGKDFAYKFVIELNKGSDQTLAAFRKIQKEFRAAIQADYLESFPRADKNALHIDFPSYKLNEGRVEGRAVVLSISVASLKYDPVTRKGLLAAKVNANQYEDARNWIRKNIETLARDKNIALTTGEIPPAAKFYLGREELKNGNILEIEFITE